METEFKKLQEEVAELKRIIGQLKSSTTIPFDIDQAFRTRFRIGDFTPLSSSAKGATTENQAVSEAGTASYSVLKAPDGFDERTDGATTKYYPYYT